MKRFGLMMLGLTLVGCAQPAPPPAEPTTAIVDSLKGSYEIGKGYLTRAAEQMEEADYAFKPAGVAEEVRSFGAIVAHVAGANGMFCSMVSGEAAPEGNPEELTAKADIQKALADSFALCDRAYASVNDETGKATVRIDFLNADWSKLGVLAFNTAHDMEHYGNLVTYMRAKGMVPPSSQPMGGN